MVQRPSPWVERYLPGIKSGGHVLDIACGGGRHIAAALAHGLSVTGVDRDISSARAAFGGQTGVALIEADLEDGRPFPFATGNFDGVIVTNYLWRPILPAIIAAVGRDGMLIYETFRTGNERFGKPSNPDFLLRPGELLAAVEGRLTVIAFEETTLAQPQRVVQRICAVGADHGWVNRPPTL
jgi:SAM-dependent methyltransferase